MASSRHKRKVQRHRQQPTPPESHEHEVENWFLTAPDNLIGVRSSGRGGVSPVLSGRFPNTSAFRGLGFLVVVIVGHLKLRRRAKRI